MQIKSKEISIVDIDSLVLNPKNNNKHSQEQIERLAKLIKHHGFRNPLVISNRSGFVIAGHGRIEAAKLAGLKEVPVMRQDFDNEASEYAYLTSDNAIASWSELDMSMVNTEMLNFPDLDIDLLGIKDFELVIPEVFEPLTDEDDVPEVVEPIVKRGDIWLLGNHRLMCGDSTSIDAINILCKDRAVDMWLTDPLYNVALGMNETPEEAKKRNRRTDGLIVQNDSMGDKEFRQFLTDCVTAADSVMKAGAVFYIWHADSEGYNFRGACQDSGWKVRQCLIWKKSSLVMGRQDYQWKHEPCLYGWKDGAGHLWAADRKQTTILEFDKPQRNGEHPTMKPVALFEYQMLNNTKGGDIVLDSFGGSGTTIIAAEKNGRIGYSMELDPKYCDVIIKRWMNFTGKKATLESTGQTYEELKVERDG